MNQWKSLVEGLYGGGLDFAQGLQQREQKNQASDLYNNTRQSYDKINQLKSRAGEIIMNMGNLNPVTGFPQVEQEDKTADINNLYGNIQENYGKLLQNPYGENYVNLLGKFYEQKPEYQYFKGNTGDYKIDKRTGKIEKFGEKTKDAQFELQDVTNPDGSIETFRLPKGQSTEDFKNKVDWVSLGTTTKDEPIKTGRSGFRGGVKNPMDNMTNKEKEMHNDLEAYRKAIEKGDNAEVNRIGDKFLNKGMDVNQLNNEYDYTGKDLKKQAGFLKDKVRTSEQINEAYNQTYKDLNMENWWTDLYGASDANDFNSRISWYEDYLKGIFPQVSKEVGAKLWSELQKAKAKIWNDKQFQ